MALFTKSSGPAQGATASGNGQGQGPAPGQYFRWPGVSARSKFVADSNNGEIVTTLSQGSQVNAQTIKLDNLDVVRSLLWVITYAGTWTVGESKSLTDSPYFPANLLQELSIQFESSFKTFRLPGILAAAMQSYRPGMSGPNSAAQFLQFGQQPANWQDLITNNPNQEDSLLLDDSVTNATTSMVLTYEVPVAMKFDRYWELTDMGVPAGPPIADAIVSPMYMAANTRNVTPKLLYCPGLTSEDLLGGGVSIASDDTTSTFSGTATANLYRDAWYPASMAASPPVYGWQYSRDYVFWPTSGQGTINIPLVSEEQGQGQILSICGFTWDPAGASGYGAPVPLSSYNTDPLNPGIRLNFSSKLPIYQDTPITNQYRWLTKHPDLLPPGFFGWDLAMTEDGKLTNEEALNTLITAGVQVSLSFNSGSAPGSTATTYIGLEMLKAVSG